MYHIKTLSILMLLPFFAACDDVSEHSSNQTPATSPPADQNQFSTEQQLTIYKSPNCGCCEKWIEHVEAQGFRATAEHPADLDVIKSRYKIAATERSCHTAVTSQGYVFEGHVPAQFIRQFLASPPTGALGLSVPAMPVGSPGMEVGDRFRPYQILLLKNDGSSEVYASIESMEQQYEKGTP
ncbi:DUF411 domain-containing protein [Lacimicrobium alkaliphilum]|uniref:Metal-binding protein n=1 Tax=Lacimicrobium alkaliphilum TaxID=1526571 RepID=A0A0U3B786_9ALTE|nr:DUF411 domain-containing protein [Lacimicrobium alkaliphilum]ALS99433.1 metal-binding protein [Lacimicrobium alkaliphilum]